MKFKLEFDLDNAAFDLSHSLDGARDSTEVHATLVRVAVEVSHDRSGMALYSEDQGKIRDVNGNTIGKWEVVT